MLSKDMHNLNAASLSATNAYKNVIIRGTDDEVSANPVQIGSVSTFIY